MKFGIKTRLFLVLFLAGLVGVASFLLVDLSALVALVPISPGSERPTVTPALKILSLIQPALLLVVAVLTGVLLAPKVGLSAPFTESLVAGRRAVPALRPQLLPAVLGGLIGGSAILLTAAVVKPFLTAETLEILEKFARLLPMPTRLLYGGITEELLLRWGVLTFFVWIFWRVFQRRRDKPTRGTFVTAILLSALIFALGHLPVAVALLGRPTFALIVFVIVANSAFGIVAGYLYWKYGLESAIIAHMLGHVVMAVGTYAGMYF
jgi:hypothetical protein